VLGRVEITLTDSQLGQLEGYRYEKKGDGLSVLLCANPNVGSGYIEAIFSTQTGADRGQALSLLDIASDRKVPIRISSGRLCGRACGRHLEQTFGQCPSG
jgi:hypothetical protein